MPEAKSQELRERVIALRQEGHPTRSVASWLGVSKAWVRRVMQVKREQGRTTPLPRGGWRYQKVDTARLRELVEQRPDATEVELHAALGGGCSVAAVGAAVRRLGLTHKKNGARRGAGPPRRRPAAAAVGAGGPRPRRRAADLHR